MDVLGLFASAVVERRWWRYGRKKRHDADGDQNEVLTIHKYINIIAYMYVKYMCIYIYIYICEAKKTFVIFVHYLCTSCDMAEPTKRGPVTHGTVQKHTLDFFGPLKKIDGTE